MLDLDNIKSSFNNKAVDWLVDRIKQDNYRGQHLVQHYRYDFDDIYKILDILNKYAPNKSLLRIRTTDLSKQPMDLLEWQDYSKFCQELNGVMKKGTQDTIRKILFVDLKRINSIDIIIKSKSEKYVYITDNGLKLLKCKDVLERQALLSQLVDIFLNNCIESILYILRQGEIKSISIYEYLYFMTAINFESNFNLTKDEAMKYIIEYRKLPQVQQKSLRDFLSQITLKTKEGKKGFNKKDFGNWINETQSLFKNFLQNTIYFILEKDKLKLSNKSGLFLDKDSKLDRSEQAKIDYFKNHNIQNKKDGFELHHIIPLSWSTSLEHFKLLDTWINLVYIDAYSHRQIRQHIILEKANREDLKLLDYLNKEIYFKKNENILYDYSNQQTMLTKNKELREVK